MPIAMSLAPLDGVVVALFVAAILALGFSARLRDASILQYLAAGRSLSLPAFVATLVSTWYGGILGVGESVSYYGLGTILLLGVPYYVFAIFYAVVLAKRVRGAEQISIPERLETRYGRNVALLGAGLLFLLAVPAAHVLMLGTLVRTLTGWELPAAVIIATVGGTLFLYKGGLLADVRASLLAFAMMYLGFAVIVGWCLMHHPLADTFARIDPALMTATGGSNWVTILGFFILGAWTLVDPGFHQRVSSAESPEIGKKGVFVSVACWMLFDVLSVTTGLYALALLKPLPEGLQVFPALGDLVLPPGLKAVFLCGMLGTILSAMVGYTLVSGATLGREIVARVRPGMSDDQIKFWTRVGFGVACVCAVALALTITSVVQLWYDWGGVVIGALLVPVVAAYLPNGRFRPASSWVFGSMLLAFFVSLAWLVYGKRTNNPYLEVVISEQRFALGTLVPGLIVSVLVLGLGQWLGRRPIQE